MSEPETILRTVFFVDGFNLYHSVQGAARDAARERGQEDPLPGYKWLNLPALFQDHLHNIDRRARLVGVDYFTAYPYHLNDAEKVGRHKAFVRANTASRTVPVTGHEGKFKARDAKCDNCAEFMGGHVEKETDVAIACSLLARSAREELDIAVIVSGDSDLSPAVRTFLELYPDKRILFAFPYRRATKELARLAPGSFSISKESYAKHQFPESVKLPSGSYVNKPAGW